LGYALNQKYLFVIRPIIPCLEKTLANHWTGSGLTLGAYPKIDFVIAGKATRESSHAFWRFALFWNFALSPKSGF
jgi:hypothetical protein